MQTYGRQIFGANAVIPTRVSADGAPRFKVGGATIDFTTVPAALGAGNDTTLPDGSVVKGPFQFLRYGQVLARITGSANTLNTSGTPTGGSGVFNVVAGGGIAQPVTIGYADSAATVQASLAALSNIGAGNVTVTGGALTTAPITITFSRTLGTVTFALSSNALTGGTAPNWAIGASLAIASNVGMFGPFDPAASDGRQTLAAGDAYVLDETLVLNPSGTVGPQTIANQGGLIDGGTVFFGRILQSGTVTHTLALGPTKAEILSTFPNFGYVHN